jgi:hypothetical protein
VDQLSTLVLIEGTEDGEQMALEGALSFKLYADLSKNEEKFFGTCILSMSKDSSTPFAWSTVTMRKSMPTWLRTAPYLMSARHSVLRTMTKSAARGTNC